jgi:glutamine amidotransferase-like uncharacterized protein
MSSSTHVFVYNGQGVSKECTDDLKVFFEQSHAVFKERPTVLTFNSVFNTDGLTCPTLAVPGGATTAEGMVVKPILAAVRKTHGANFNYVGVCAGGFLGTDEADMFYASPVEDRQCVLRRGPSLTGAFMRTAFTGVNLSLIDDYKAIGAFYPLDEIVVEKGEVPYCVSISLSGTQKKLKQLYCSGPGFFAAPNKHGLTEVVATYTDRNDYPFYYDDGKCVTLNSLSAVISKKPDDTHGGVYLSGVHFEAAVPDSKFFTLCKNGEKGKFVALSPDNCNALDESKPETIKFVEDSLSRVLK